MADLTVTADSGGSGTVSGAAPAPAWPPAGIRPLIDTLSDAVVAVGPAGSVLYANPAAERLFGWASGALVGRPISVFVPPRLRDDLMGRFARLSEQAGASAQGTRLEATSLRRDGTEFPSEVVLTLVGPGGDSRVLLGVVRPREDQRFQRLGDITSRLLETLTDEDSGIPAERQLLADLGGLLDWDLTSLWTLAQPGELVFRHVWIRPGAPKRERLTAARPPAENQLPTLPLHVLHSGEPLWVADLGADERFATGPAASSGLRSALVFPVRYRSEVVGVVELLSTEPRQLRPEVLQLLQAISSPLGQMLAAIEQAAERERLLVALTDARRNQDFLLRATRVLAEASDYRDTLDSLATVAVPALADLCLIDVLDQHGSLRRMAARHADPAKAPLAAELLADFPPDPLGAHPIVEVAHLGQPQWSPDMSDEFLRATTRNQRHFEVVKALGFTSYVAVPLVNRGEVLGTVTLISAGSGRRFGERDLWAAQQLADQVASVVERARRHERDHEMSHMLQRSLLPESLPHLERVALAGIYLPAADFTEVGGDWYDAFVTGDRLALVIGDVEGHDLRAASVMGKVGNALRAFLLEDPSPASALGRLNRFMLTSRMDRLATVLACVLDPADGTTVAVSCGHPAPVTVAADGTVRRIELHPYPPLGVEAFTLEESTVDLAGTTTLLYTDGLVEDRQGGADARLPALMAAMAAHGGAEAEEMGSAVIDAVLPTSSRRDDVALLVVRTAG